MTKLKPILLLSLILVSSVNAQDYTIVTEAKRTVPPVQKINERPQIVDTIIPIPKIEHQPLNRMAETGMQLESIKPAKLKVRDKLSQIYNSYAKAGIGNYISPLGEIYVNSTRSRANQWGIHGKHFSSWGTIEDYAPSQLDRNSVDAYFKSFQRKGIFNSKVNFFNNGLHHYGFLEDSTVLKDSIRQRFNSIGATIGWNSYKEDSAEILYDGALTYNYFNDLRPEWDTTDSRNARENYVGLDGALSYQHKNECYRLGIRMDYNNYRFGVDDTLATDYIFRNDNNFIFEMAPSVQTQHKNISARLGVGLVGDFARDNAFYIYPRAEASMNVLEGLLVPYLGIDGGLEQNTFRRLSQQNNFVISSLDLRNESTSYDIYLGIKGSMSDHFTYHLKGSYQRIKDRALFVTDTVYSFGNRFNAVYDTLQVASIQASGAYELSDQLNIEAIATYYNYQTQSEVLPWNLPEFEFTLRGKYNLYDKVIAQIEFNLLTGRKSFTPFAGDEGLETIDGVNYINLGVLADANFNIEYRYNERFSVFLQMNNFAAQQYLRWYNYPVQQFQILGVATFRF